MILKNLAEIINGFLEKGMDENTIVFVPRIEGDTLLHTDADLLVINLAEDKSEELGIVIFPSDSNYYELEKDKEITQETISENDL